MMFWVIAMKELFDNLRDRKGVIEAILVPVFLGVFQALLIPVLDDFMLRGEDDPRTVPVVGLQDAPPEFTETMQAFNIVLKAYDGDAEALHHAVMSKSEMSGLVLTPGFADALQAGERPAITVLTNQTAGNLVTGAVSHARLFLALDAFNRQSAVGQLIINGIDPAVLDTLTLQTEELSTPAQRGGTAAGAILTLMVVYIVASGGLYIAIDVTAGEKERGTLEALFVTPVSDTTVLLGKTLAVCVMSLIPLLLSFAGFYVAANIVSDPTVMTLPLHVVVKAALLSIPVGLLVNVVTMILTVRTRAFKDAQSAATPMILVLTLVGMAAAFVPAASQLAYFIPVYGAASAVAVISSGGVVPLVSLGMSIAGTLGAAVVAFGVALHLFNRERMLYG